MHTSVCQILSQLSTKLLNIRKNKKSTLIRQLDLMLTWEEHNSDSTYTGSPSSLAWATKKLPFFGWSCKSVRQVKSKLSDTISFNLHVTGWTYFHSVLPCRQRQPPERNLSLLFAFHLKFEAIVALSLFILLPKTRSHSRPITLLFTPQSWQKTAWSLKLKIPHCSYA